MADITTINSSDLLEPTSRNNINTNFSNLNTDKPDKSENETITGNWDFEGTVDIETANGLDITPGSDTDTDLITLNVTGTPKLWWDESKDKFSFNNSVELYNTSGNLGITISSADGSYSNVNLDDQDAEDGANFGIYNGYPNAGDFTLRENGVQNIMIMKKTSGDVDIVNGTLKIGGSQISSSDLSDVSSIAMLDENETITGDWQFNSRIGVGGAETSSSVLRLYPEDPTVDSNDSNNLLTIFSVNISADIASGVTDSGYRRGLAITQKINDNSNFEGTLDELTAIYAEHGIYDSAAGATVTDSYGVRIMGYGRAGTITNSYGLYIDAPATGGTVTNEYAIYSADDADSHLEGGLTLGSSDNYALAGDTSNSTQVLRRATLTIQDGTNANTLKCTVSDTFNGDAIGETDNINKDATTGNFTLSANGEALRIEAAGLTGNVLMAHGTVRKDWSGNNSTSFVAANSNDIRIYLADGSDWQDLTSIVDSGIVRLDILYITDN